MTKFGFLFISLFIGVTIVLLLVPRKGIFRPVDKNIPQPSKPKLSYIQLVLLISGIISFVVLILVKLIMQS